MALVKLGVAFADVRGSIGGTVFARNRGGAYIRNRTVPLNPASTSQGVVRANVGSLSAIWTNTLTQVQRDAWTLYANNVPLLNSLGESRHVSGLNMFIRTNTLQLYTGGARIDAAPTNFTVGPTITPTFTVNAAADTFIITSVAPFVPSATNIVTLLIQQGLPQNPGVQFYKSPFRKVASFLLDLAGDLPTAATALAFPVVAGHINFFRTASISSDGRVGVPTVVRFPVV